MWLLLTQDAARVAVVGRQRLSKGVSLGYQHSTHLNKRRVRESFKILTKHPPVHNANRHLLDIRFLLLVVLTTAFA
jgi:hypothetical protein